jgi:3',5'-cyclic AMP phosphodiesterase CpdA
LLLSVVTTLAISFPDDPPPLPTYEGTGTFLMLSDIHFDPFGDSAVAGSLGAKLNEGCRISDAGSIATVGNDTNYPLLKSTLDEVVATAAQNHFRYDFVIVTGDLLAHSFDTRYAQCVGDGEQAYRKFSSDTIRFVDGMISKALPGIPVFAALGNNDSDRGDYQEPSNDFLESVGQDWSRAWGNLPLAARKKVLSHFERAGYYAAPDPVVAKHEFVILNSNLWAARNTQACSATDLDPGGQFQWLGQVLSEVKQAGGTATLIMHIPPGIDAMR